MSNNFCLSCGTALPPGSQFCPSCGLEVIAPVHTIRARPAAGETPSVPMQSANPVGSGPIPVEPSRVEQSWVPVAPDRTKAWMIAAGAVVAVVGIAIALLLAAPFGRDDKLERRTVQTDTIGEAPAPQARPPLGVEDSTAGVTTAAPSTQPVTATTATAESAAPPEREPASSPSPAAAAAAGDEGSARVSESEAVTIVRSAALNYYNGVAGDCQDVRSQGFINVGYTMAVVDQCSGGSELGRWRVDARNGDVFRQRSDGRYVKP